MNVQEAIMAFSQSEKIKSGIIWVSHSFEVVKGFQGYEKRGAERTIKTIIDMMVQEVRLSNSLVQDESWGIIESYMDKAIMMIESGVGSESVVHLTQALSQTTSIGHRPMFFLKEQGLL